MRLLPDAVTPPRSLATSTNTPGYRAILGQPISFVYEVTGKASTAKKVRVENSVPEIPLSNEAATLGPSRTSTPREVSASSFQAKVPRRYDTSRRFLTS